MSLLKGLNKGTNNKKGNGYFSTNVKVDGSTYKVILKQSPKTPEVFSGSLFRGNKNEETGRREESYRLTWNIKKYDLIFINGLSASTDEEEVTIMNIRKAITSRVLSVAQRDEHVIAETYSKFHEEVETEKETTTASEEAAVSSDAPEVESEDKEIVKPAISNAKAYCNRLGARSYAEGLEHAIVELHKQATYISELEAKIENLKNIPAAEKELTREEIDQIVYDYMPAEFAQAPARVEELEEMVAKLQSDNKSLNSDLEKAEDAYYAATNTIDDLTKDIQPKSNEKVEVEVQTLDITAIKNEIKSELKAELLEELKAELKAQSPAPVVKEEPKKEVKKEEIKKETKAKEDVDTKLVIPGKTTKTKKEEDKKVEKKPEVKVEQPKKKKKLSEMTYEDLANAEYEKLQKIGSALKLGSANVAKKADLVILIAKKLKLTIPAAKSASDDVDTTIVKPQTNSSLAAKRNNFSEIEDEMLDEIMDEIDDSDLGGSDIKVQDEYTVELNDAQKKLKAMLNAKANK